MKILEPSARMEAAWLIPQTMHETKAIQIIFRKSRSLELEVTRIHPYSFSAQFRQMSSLRSNLAISSALVDFLTKAQHTVN